jgi:hypothetical protein
MVRIAMPKPKLKSMSIQQTIPAAMVSYENKKGPASGG